MSSNSETNNNQNTTTAQSEIINEEKLPTNQLKIREFFSSWKIKLGISLTILFAWAILIFFWPHLIAVTGMKMWASHAKAIPIDCMMKDTNGDEYISCTAKMDEQIVPLECGISLFNIGCRVTYGSASPSIRTKNP